MDLAEINLQAHVLLSWKQSRDAYKSATGELAAGQLHRGDELSAEASDRSFQLLHSTPVLCNATSEARLFVERHL